MDVRGLDPHFAPSSRLSSVSFLTYTGDEIERISCKRITNPVTLDSLYHPNLGGLYDPALGPSNKDDLCGTCGLNYVYCPGHFGHISLPLPVYHPAFFTRLCKILRSSCWNCHKFLCSVFKGQMFVGQLELIDNGLLMEASSLEDTLRMKSEENSPEMCEEVPDVRTYVERCKRVAAEKYGCSRTKNVVELRKKIVQEFLEVCCRQKKKCVHCKAPVPSIREEGQAKIFLGALSSKEAEVWKVAHLQELKRKRCVSSEMTESLSKDERGGKSRDLVGSDEPVAAKQFTKQRYLNPLEVREHFYELWLNHKMIMSALVGCSSERREELGDTGTTHLQITRRRHVEKMSPEDVFFLQVIPVPPSRFRPVSDCWFVECGILLTDQNCISQGLNYKNNNLVLLFSIIAK